MKLNKCFITCYLLVLNTLYHPHTFINLSPTFIFSVSNRITKQKSEVFDNQSLPIFFIAFLASFWRDTYLQSTNFLL